MNGRKKSPVRDLLLRNLGRAFDQRSWHGSNLKGLLRGVGAETAAWRLQPQRHNIWELVVHAAYWKYRVWRLVAGERAASFDLKGSDWFSRPSAELSDRELEPAWRADVALLEAWHRKLYEAVAEFPESRLGTVPGRGSWSYEDLIAGAASHDLYHAGQIGLLRRMAKEAFST